MAVSSVRNRRALKFLFNSWRKSGGRRFVSAGNVFNNLNVLGSLHSSGNAGFPNFFKFRSQLLSVCINY